LARATTAYTYDAAGRRTSMGGSYARVNLPPALTSATYDAANKRTNWAGTAQTYDLNGNLTGDGTRTYTWDTRDRLTATNGGGQTSSYVYDAFGRRISRTISGTQTAYVHDGHNPVHTGTGSTITGTLLNGGGLDERYVRTVGGANTALLTDALGSLLHIVDAAGATTATCTYEPYGAVTSSGPDSTGFQYTGREVDVGGLMYYRARYYNPRRARFISEDPIGLAGGDNLYGYVSGSPTNATDPTGEVGVFGAVVGAGIEFGIQYGLAGGDLKKVDFWAVGVAGAAGAVGGAALGGAFRHSLSGKAWTQASHSWGAVSARMHRLHDVTGRQVHFHHWAIPRKWPVPDFIKNHPWNLNPVAPGVHARIHGDFNAFQRWWYGVPSWAKAGQASIAGGLAADCFWQ
jgi:RHS repeat-associated protein